MKRSEQIIRKKNAQERLAARKSALNGSEGNIQDTIESVNKDKAEIEKLKERISKLEASIEKKCPAIEQQEFQLRKYKAEMSAIETELSDLDKVDIEEDLIEEENDGEFFGFKKKDKKGKKDK